jgi:hypothetical protein
LIIRRYNLKTQKNKKGRDFMEKVRPKRPVAGFIVMIVVAFAFYALGMAIKDKTFATILPSYGDWLKAATEGDFGAKIAWLIADWTQPAYQGTLLGGVFMIAAAAIVALSKKKTTFGICYGTGLFWRILSGQLIAAVIANFVFTTLFKNNDQFGSFAPTFIPIASITPGLILLYGGEWRKVITAGVMGGFIGAPLAAYIFVKFVGPWGLIGAVAWVTPMIIGGIVCGEVCKYLPWMAKQASDPETPAPAASDAPAGEAPKMNDGFFIKRVLADFSEANFYGSEIAGLLFIIGGVVSVFLNPANPGYGSGIYLILLTSQILASAVGIFLYWHRLYELGGYPTFVPVVTLGPTFVLLYGTAPHVVITGAVLGGMFMPPVANYISSKLPPSQPGYIGCVASMFICCIVFIAVFNYVPGFGV